MRFLGEIVRRLGLQCDQYADDMWFYLSIYISLHFKSDHSLLVHCLYTGRAEEIIRFLLIPMLLSKKDGQRSVTIYYDGIPQ